MNISIEGIRDILFSLWMFFITICLWSHDRECRKHHNQRKNKGFDRKEDVVPADAMLNEILDSMYFDHKPFDWQRFRGKVSEYEFSRYLAILKSINLLRGMEDDIPYELDEVMRDRVLGNDRHEGKPKKIRMIK